MGILLDAIIVKLSGDPDQLNLDTTTITQAAKSGESNVILFTGKDIWQEGDFLFDSALDAGYKFAVSFIRSHGNEKEKQQDQEFQLAVQLCTKINELLKARGLLASSVAIVEGYGINMEYPNDPVEPIMLNDYGAVTEGTHNMDDPNIWYP
jgi:hypothetical protein